MLRVCFKSSFQIKDLGPISNLLECRIFKYVNSFTHLIFCTKNTWKTLSMAGSREFNMNTWKKISMAGSREFNMVIHQNYSVLRAMSKVM